MVVSKTLDQAQEIILQTKNNIEHNEILMKLKPSNKSITEGRSKWTSQEVVTTTNCRLFTNPYNSSILGKHVSMILLDEAGSYDDPSIYFEKVAQCADEGHICLISTPWHEMDLCMRLKDKDKYPDYDFNIYRAVKEDGTPLWETKYSKEKLDFYRRNEGDAAFNKNYLCNLVSDDVSLMPVSVLMRGWVQGANESLLLRKPPQTRTIEYKKSYGISDKLLMKPLKTNKKEEDYNYYCGIDLAQSPSGDYTAIVIVEKTREKVNGKPVFKIVYIHRSKGNNPDMHRTLMKETHDKFYPYIRNTMVDRSQFGEFVIKDIANDGMNVEGFYFSHENRNMLLRNLITIVNQERLIIPRKNGTPETNGSSQTEELTDILTKELSQIVPETTPRGMQSYKSVGMHDDLCMALGLALLAASYEQDTTTYIRKDTY